MIVSRTKQPSMNMLCWVEIPDEAAVMGIELMPPETSPTPTRLNQSLIS